MAAGVTMKTPARASIFRSRLNPRGAGAFLGVATTPSVSVDFAIVMILPL
jgi:hypothetical protein